MTNKKNKAKSFITCKQKGSNPYLINKGRVVMDDREIIKLYNCRSEDALLETEKKYGKLVSFIIGKLIKNQLDVEECTNDTYLGVWFTIPPKTPDNLKAYILKIARNQALKKYEHIHAAKRDIDMCLPYEELSNYLAKVGGENWENNELKDIVEDFLESLQKPHRQVFVLRYWYFMSVKEIMKCCNMSKSKVETILFRTRKKAERTISGKEVFMKTLKSDIFYAMNEINDKYILEAAQCLEQKKENDISLQKNSKLFHESNAHSRKWLARVATAMAVSIILFTAGGIANAATGEKLVQWINGLFGAELVTDENEGLIGKEVIDNSEPEVTHGEESDIGNAEGRAITESHIIKSVADDNIVLPLSVSEFKVENDTTPEIIMTNGSMAVFYLEDYAGWNCKAGDILTFSFEKYESDAVSNQALVIGYIKDGVMYDGESFGSLSGSYELKVREGGEYNLYIISATSDYLTLKQGTINLSK